MNHHFSVDPRGILGVDEDASPEEIDRAFREKAKKHHPDHGGDEWAFRMVLRANEILRTIQGMGLESLPRGAGEPPPGPMPNPSSSSPFEAPDAPVNGFQPRDGERERTAGPSREEFRTVGVELVWIRFEADQSPGVVAEPRPQPADTTLSVCLVITWPRVSLVESSAAFPDAAETLRAMIVAFEHLGNESEVLAQRSRIEDGQFVGWLSYPDVVQAEASFQSLRDELSRRDLRVSLQTRDEPIPLEWMSR